MVECWKVGKKDVHDYFDENILIKKEDVYMYVNTEIMRDIKPRVPECGDLLYVPTTEDVYLVCEFLERVLGDGTTKAVVRLRDGAMWNNLNNFMTSTKCILIPKEEYCLTLSKL